MIMTIVRISWLNLKRDRLGLALTFSLPLAFFSVFALVFGGMDRDTPQTIELALVLEERTSTTLRLQEIIEAGDVSLVELDEADGVLSRERLRELVRRGEVDAVILVPLGFTSRLAAAGAARPEVWVCVNEAHPPAEPVTRGIVQSATLAVVLEAISPPGATNDEVSTERGLVRVHVDRPFSAAGKKPSVAYFAAGIGVMFLLFSVSGRSSILIEERESGVLTRLVASQITLSQFLTGRWIFLVMLGFVQVTVMFVWASIAFGLDLWTPPHLAGFIVMTLASASAAAGLGVLLAVFCRSRTQLNGVAVVLILIMSVLGGSMFPRFLMPESMQLIGQFTFNAWALDGYQKVFWYDVSILDLLPEASVLVGASLVSMLIAIWKGKSVGSFNGH